MTTSLWRGRKPLDLTVFWGRHAIGHVAVPFSGMGLFFYSMRGQATPS